MRRVVIECSNLKGWVDHLGKPIDKLVFSKKHYHVYEPGHYPLESFGSLYRNIDDFRESPLQSRTDWEIRIPSIYSSAIYGSADVMVNTVDLLYWIESENEKNGLEFDLIGCPAILYDDDRVIYKGIVESVVSGTGTSSMRISDFLGNPKSSKSNFPFPIGLADLKKWPVIVTRENGVMRLEISDRPLKHEPKFFLNLGQDEWLEVSFDAIEYTSADYLNAIINILHDSICVLENADIGLDDDLIFPLMHNGEFMRDILRPEKNKDTPDFYTIGEGDNSEIFQAWSYGHWNILGNFGNSGNVLPSNGTVFSVGRDIPSKRHRHKGTLRIRKVLSEDYVMLNGVAICAAESISIGFDDGLNNWYNPPYQKGSPFQLALNSKHPLNTSDAFPDIDFLGCPVIRGRLKFKVNLTSQNLPSGTKIRLGSIMAVALKYEMPEGSDAFLSYFTINGKDSKYGVFPRTMTGKLYGFSLNDWEGEDLSSSMSVTFNLFGLKSPEIEVGFVQILYNVGIPIGNNKLYASGEFADSELEEMDPEKGMTVKPLIEKLLNRTKVSRYLVSGKVNEFLYGTIITGEAFALRDKLRSLAAESTTVVKFGQQSNGNDVVIDVVDISLQKNIESVSIPLAAFVHDGNIYSFKMESTDRSELLSEVSIFWGKDIETKKYDHVLSVSIDGISEDGELRDSSDMWEALISRMRRNVEIGIGINKTVESEWITNWEAARNMAYNLLLWNTKPLRKSQARCIFTVLSKYNVDIGSFVSFALPGYPKKFSKIRWMVTGRHDDLDSMVTTLELLETSDSPVASQNRYLLLEDRRNILTELLEKIKLEE